jgi:hypothetical protein
MIPADSTGKYSRCGIGAGLGAAPCPHAAPLNPATSIEDVVDDLMKDLDKNAYRTEGEKSKGPTHRTGTTSESPTKRRLTTRISLEIKSFS